MKIAAALSLSAAVAAVAGTAAAQQAVPTPPPQSVVVPSLPDQKNKETTARPSGALAVDAAGWVKNGPTDPAPKAAADPASATERVPPGRGAPGAVSPPLLPPGPAPSGPAVVGAAHVTLRGVVKRYQKGTSITIVDAAGRERTVPLAEKAAVYEGLKTGDRIVLTIPLGSPADGKSADRVEREKPKKQPPKSIFAAAQTPAD
ncbi:MAG: hypothetical protein ACHQPI_00605 [Thermoanaerobaculia bacterium]